MRSQIASAFLAGLLATLTGCGSSSENQTTEPPQEPVAQFVFQQQGLAGLIVERLYQRQGKVLALTSNGLYQQQGEGWELLGFQGLQPRDLAFVSDQHWLLALTISDSTEQQDHQLHETFDAGRTWRKVQRNFGVDGANEAIFALRYDPASGQLLATGVNALASSADYGSSWRLLSGSWSGFGHGKSALGVDPVSNNIWWGGQGALEDGVLNVYQPGSQSSKEFRGLLPDPSVYYSVRFRYNSGSSDIYACGEGGIVYSADQGQSWRNLMGNVNYRFYFDVAIDPDRRNRLYTAGWDKSYDQPQPLILQWSDDNGSTWQRLPYQAPSSFFGGVRSLLLVKQQDRSYLYLGLFKGGVMRVSVNR